MSTVIPITGETRLFAIVADPIAQVRTPQAMNDYFREHAVDGVLVPMHVSTHALEPLFTALRGIKNLGGFIVTVPHKTSAAALCDAVGDAGAAIGAVNVVRRSADGRLIGDMLDGVGFLRGLRAEGHDPAGKHVLLLGAGGAATAIAFALAGAGVASLTVFNRTLSRAQELVTRTATHFPQVKLLAGQPSSEMSYDLVVNATSLGMNSDDAYPLSPEHLKPHMLVAEIIMKPELTPLLVAAKRKGCSVHHGRHMLDHQIRSMADFMVAKD